MVDQCKHCDLRGDINACLFSECFHHENWMAKQQAERIKALEDKVQSLTTLISVKEHPPERIQGNKVLGFGEGYFFECEYDDGYWCNLCGVDMTHYILLPESPES